MTRTLDVRGGAGHVPRFRVVSDEVEGATRPGPTDATVLSSDDGRTAMLIRHWMPGRTGRACGRCPECKAEPVLGGLAEICVVPIPVAFAVSASGPEIEDYSPGR